MLDKLQKAYADRIEKRVFRWIRKLAADRVARQGGPQSSYDHLLLDDRDKFFEEEFHDIKYLEVENPADLRTGPVIDGRLPNGEPPTLLGYRHVSDQAAKGFMRGVIDKALKASLMTSASIFTGYLVAAGCLNFAKGLLTAPDWNLGSWVWELPVGSLARALASESVLFLADLTLRVISMVTSNSMAFAVGGGFSVAAGLLAGAYVFINAINRGMVRYRHLLTDDLSLPTREAMGAYYWSDPADRREHMAANENSISDSRGWLKDKPFIMLGTATGILANRGARFAPSAGQVFGLDGVSMRQHSITVGETGTGKTELFIKPMFVGNFSADWGDERMGGLILDGKGKLAFILRELLPAHRKRDFALIGNGPGHYGVDLLASMTPIEVQTAFQNAAEASVGGGETGKWISGAANALKEAAFIADFVENNIKGTIWAGRPYKPYSLLGLKAIVLEQKLNKALAEIIKKKAEAEPDTVPYEVLAACDFFMTTWKEYASDTRTSYESNLTDTLGMLSGTRDLARKFASGKLDDVDMIDIAEAFNGKILGIGLSGIEDQRPGIFIANWIKSRFYLIAQRRITAAGKAQETLNKIEECKLRYRGLVKHSARLSRLLVRFEKKLPTASRLFAKFFPNQPNDLPEVGMLAVVIEELKHLKMDRKQFSQDVRRLSNPEPTPEILAEIKELERIANLPKTSSAMITIDEYHLFCTVGNTGSDDTSFLNIARESGAFVCAATQTFQAIYQAVGRTPGDNILGNFVNRVCFRSQDPDTLESFIKLAGTSIQGPTSANNMFGNFTQLLNFIDHEPPAPPKVSWMEAISPNLRKRLREWNPLLVDFQEVDVGTKMHTEIETRDPNSYHSAASETRSRRDAKQEAQKQEILSGAEKSLISINDFKKFGGAFCSVSRAGQRKMDFVRLG